MDIHVDPRPAACRAWGLCWGMLLALLYLLWPTGVAQAQAEPISYVLKQQAARGFVVPGTPISFTVSIKNTGGAVITSLPLTDTYDAQHLLFTGATPPPDQSRAGHLTWNNLVASCGGALEPQEACPVVVSFVSLQKLGNTSNMMQSGSQQSRAAVRIVAEVQKPVPLNPHNSWVSADADVTLSVAWGDMDGDGDLDLTAGGRPSKVYRNEGGVLQTSPAWVSDHTDPTQSVAWGDMDGDGDLDLAVGNSGSPNKVYRNEGGVLQTSPAWVSDHTDYTASVAWGDMDGDGDLDLATGNSPIFDDGCGCLLGGANKVYRNEGGVLQTSDPWVSADADDTTSVAWGDMDGDGDLDLAAGNLLGPSKVYRNEGGVLQTRAAWVSAAADTDYTRSVAWGDMDGDGDLDLAAGNFNSPSKVYRNEGGVLQTSAAWVSDDKDDTTSVAWGDMDGDGDLDLAAGNEYDPNKVYRNEGGVLQTSAAWVSADADRTYSVAWGDMDGDGDLDLVAGNERSPNKVYRNEGGVLQTSDPWTSADKDPTFSVAWGDMDGDGDLDLAAGKWDSPSKVYRNEGGVLQTSDPWVSAAADTDYTRSVAWGDMDGDGDLDLATGNSSGFDFDCECFLGSPNKVYRNEGGVLQSSDPWTSDDTDDTYSVAWGDMDGDGDLDLAAGNSGSPSKVYRNEGGILQTHAAWVSADTYNTTSVAWGDMDGDGDLDLATGNSSGFDDDCPCYRGGANKVYRNEGGVLQTSAAWVSTDIDATGSVAWGDMDGDGDLDLAAGNSGSPSKVYRNEGGILQTSAAWVSADTDDTYSVAWGDMDGDGDLDLAASGWLSKVYRNEGGVLQTRAAWVSADADVTQSVAWGDMDGDGDLDLAAGNWNSPSKVYRNMRQGQRGLPNNAPAVTVARPITPLLTSSAIAIPYTLFDPEGDPVGRIELAYSLNGGGQWRPAVATAATRTTNLASAKREAGGRSHLFTWDTFASGFFGQSDNVVLRLQVYPQPKPSASPNTYRYTNSTPDSYQRPYASAVTFPLRVRGTQVRVMNNGSSSPQPTANARVYRLPGGQSSGAQPIRNGVDGTPYRTDRQGYLQGRGQLAVGDRLVALAPITATESYTLYYTSATPTLTGLNVYTVTAAGVQTLTVSAANPLLLFNLDVALEWDARKDAAFLNQLEFDLRRTSEFLFDATDGQAVLGEITLYHNKENWAGADLRIYASNALIPNADPGGIVRSEVSEIIASNPFINATTPYSITYQPGTIRMGAVWNRFGEATGTLGEDWPRTLAHEIGHYAFYLYDNYLGLQDGVVVPVDTCTGTLMSDQYREDFSEFRTVTNWATACGQTVSAQRSGRADWQTITRFYPWLKMPSGPPNLGPVTLPLAVTQVQSRFAPTPTLPLDVAVFDLVNPVGAVQTSGPHAQAVLYSQERLIDLGHPVVDKLEARGAHVGDRLCIYDLPEKRLGCETITANDNFLTLASRDDWQPEIVVSPVTSRTVSVLVSNVAAGLPLKGKLYPENSPATTEIAFVPWPGGAYSTTFQLATGVLAGHIQIWVEEAARAQQPRRESLTSYALGGSPGKLKKPPKGNKRSLDLSEQSASQEATPAIAPDGQVLIYGNVSFSDGEFYALQKVNRLPVTPLWTTVVGDGYRILKSAKAPDLVNTSILFRYRGQDVPAGEESFLSLYFWEEAKAQWRKLPTVLNRAVNEASAQAPGPGLYVLMSSLEIPIRRIGWNLVAYPVQQTRPVSEALASLAGSYALVYSYVITDTVDPWKLYAPEAPAYVNDLTSLHFGQGYWINATQPMTWLVKGPDQATVQAAATHSLPTPPATFYGAVLPGRGLTPAVGQPVQALINGALCGESVTQAVAGQIVYSLNVEGDGATDPNCVGLQQRVVITVAGLPLEVVFWQNDVVQMVGINGPKYFFPIIRLRHWGQ